MELIEIKERLRLGLADLAKEDYRLFHVDSNERSIAHKLAERLVPHFSPWDVDCEYNRIGKEKRHKLVHVSKKAFMHAKEKGIIPNHIIPLEELEERKDAVPIFPDIIVHRRTEIFENLLIIEIKKLSNAEVFSGWDQWKIRFFIDNLKYSAGCFIVLNTGIETQNLEELIHSQEWFSL